MDDLRRQFLNAASLFDIPRSTFDIPSGVNLWPQRFEIPVHFWKWAFQHSKIPENEMRWTSNEASFSIKTPNCCRSAQRAKAFSRAKGRKGERAKGRKGERASGSPGFHRFTRLPESPKGYAFNQCGDYRSKTPKCSASFSAFGFSTMPRSVMMAVTSSAGVTSKAGFITSAASGTS
ncbi:hypothetical protein Q31b_41430 [Novipirellula aureliae]|uniref:Uncharacterized protein n=1 Tax=Novipirellula aureliae TaxID=2527966 RepID=A0A5C6DUG3_9BACT|nr:hypothetical protein Q31b_41430 [Novipirellula aureliae]